MGEQLLDYRQKKIVDKTWDSIWSSGVTNPIVVLDLIATVLMARKVGVGAWLDLKEAVYGNDTEKLVEIIQRVRHHHGFDLGSEIENREFWPNTRVLEGAVAQMELLLNSPGDIIGDTFEHFLAKLTTAGTFGQFRTPAHLVDFLVAMVKPAEGELVMDPACGTGSFLIHAADYRRRTGATGEYVGFEIDRTISRIAQANLVFHDISKGTVLNSDGLIENTDIRPNVILANPPFAGNVSPEVKRIIGFGTNKSELLFLKTMIDRLAAKGRAAVIVPAGVLSTAINAGLNIREHLVEDMKLEAVVELPANAFAPYTGVKTGVLLWRNERHVGQHHQVLMARVDNDGYSLDARRSPIESNDLPGTLELLSGELATVPHAYIPVQELRAADYNLTPSRYIDVPADHKDALPTPDEALLKVQESVQLLALRVAEIREILQ